MWQQFQVDGKTSNKRKLSFVFNWLKKSPQKDTEQRDSRHIGQAEERLQEDTDWQTEDREGDNAQRKHVQTGCSFHGSFCEGSGKRSGLAADRIFITSESTSQSQLRSNKTTGTDLGCAAFIERIGTCRDSYSLCSWLWWRPCLLPVTRHPFIRVQLPARDFRERRTNEHQTAHSGLLAVQSELQAKLLYFLHWYSSVIRWASLPISHAACHMAFV